VLLIIARFLALRQRHLQLAHEPKGKLPADNLVHDTDRGWPVRAGLTTRFSMKRFSKNSGRFFVFSSSCVHETFSLQ
jgi:hypothetical protein